MVKAETPIRIGLSGKARSGKDTAAAYLVFQYGFSMFAFADRLKALAVELFGMDPGEKDRALLVGIARRLCELDPLVWVNRVLVDAIQHGRVVVTDVRMPAEWHALKAFGFTMVRVEASADVRHMRALANGDKIDEGDPSETALDAGYEWDFVIRGDGPKGDMYASIDGILGKFGLRDLRK